MQRPIFTIVILAISSVFFARKMPCNAQRVGQHEIQISYGPLAREQVFDDATTGYFGSLFGQSLPKLDFSNSHTVTYRYQVHRRLAIGAVSGFTKNTTYNTYYSQSQSFYKNTGLITAFETKFTISDTQFVQLYAITGLGILLVRSKDRRQIDGTKTYGWPTCQLTPFGIRIGRTLGGFAEIGYGYKGIVNFGVSARF